MDYLNLRLIVSPPIARIVLSRRAEGNRIDLRTLRELDDAASCIGADPSVLVTTIEAAGDDFCAGWDEADRDEMAAARLEDKPASRGPFEVLASLSSVTIAAMAGRATSAGLELALACDIRICAADARFAMPDVSEGHVPMGGATQRLPRLIGKSWALMMLLAGSGLSADDALRRGLVSRVVPSAELSSTVAALAAHISERGPLALRYAKEAVQRGLELPLEQALRYETDLSVILQTTADRAEGVRAFFEKRPPRFQGR